MAACASGSGRYEYEREITTSSTPVSRRPCCWVQVILRGDDEDLVPPPVLMLSLRTAIELMRREIAAAVATKTMSGAGMVNTAVGPALNFMLQTTQQNA